MTEPGGSIGHQLDSGRSWLVALAAATSMFATFGVAYSFGAFFESMSDEFGTSSSATALVFSLTISLSFLFGLWTGRWADRVGPRPVLLAAAASLTAGLLLTSLVQSTWLGYLTYGLGVGFAVACGYVPMVAAVGGWFDKGRTTALGIAVAGIGVGTLVAVPIITELIERNGWRSTYRLLGLVSFGLLAIASLGAHRPPTPPEPPLPILDAIRGRADFWLVYVATFFVSIALFTPFVYVSNYIDTEDVDGSAPFIIGLIGITSVAGRLGLGALAARVPIMLLFRVSFAVLGSSFIIWILAGSSFAGLVVFGLVLGIGYGGFIALSPAVVAELFGPVGMGGILGALYSAAGLGGLLGPPAIGFVIDNAGWNTALTVAMVSGLVGFAMLMLVKPGHSVTASANTEIVASSIPSP